MGESGNHRMGKDVFLSIVIPAYNEESRLSRTLRDAASWCSVNVPTHEIVVVDDGSSDDTLDIARSIAESLKQVKVLARPHLGKGAAVKAGMLSAEGEYVLFMDADGATPMEETKNLLAMIEKGYPVAIGSRASSDEPEGKVVVMSFHRKMIGSTFAALVRMLAVPGIKDTQCGFKMFTKDASRMLFGRQTCNGFAFDVEILHLADKLSLPVAEVTVNWVSQEGSKVRIAKEGPRMLFDVMKIRLLHRNRP